MKKRILSLLLICIMLASTMATASFADQGDILISPAPSKTVTIIHTNDVHSRVNSDSAGIGYSVVSAIAKEVKAATGIEPILVDAGDAFHGQTIATLERGESIVNIMNTVGYDVMAPGNHDFNYGQDRLLELAQKADFKIVSANVVKKDGSKFLDEYTIIERDGIKIAFFGLSTPETAYKTNPKNVTDLTFIDPVKEAETTVGKLQGKADVIVCVSHLGLDEASTETSKKLAEKVNGIDLIIDGHSHTALSEPLKINNTLIVQTGEYLKNVGAVKISFDETNKITEINASLISKEQTAEMTADADVEAAIASYKEAQQEILAKVVAVSDINLDGEREHVRTGPTNLSCLITSAMIDETGADLAITNGGGIRASIKPGNITINDIITVLPFGNYIVTKKMKGSDIKAALEHGLSQYPNANGGFPQLANVKYLFDEKKPAGERVTHIWIKGVKLDPNKEYTVATNDFMAVGGDGYPFADLPLINEYRSLDEALIAYIQKNSKLIRYNKYVVKPGDALWKIAQKAGHDWIELAKINDLKNPDLIYAGDTLLIPAW